MSTQRRNGTPITETSSHAEGDAPAAPAITAVANASRRRRKVEIQAAWTAFIQGILTNYAQSESFRLPDGTLTRDQLAARLGRFIASAEKTKAKHREYLAAVEAERRTFSELRPTYDCAASIVRGHHGRESRRLLDFGIAPARPRNVSAATQYVAAEKAKATREARGTMGKRQREKIRGELPPDGAAAAVIAASRAAALMGVARGQLAASSSHGAELHAGPVVPVPAAELAASEIAGRALSGASRVAERTLAPALAGAVQLAGPTTSAQAIVATAVQPFAVAGQAAAPGLQHATATVWLSAATPHRSGE